MSVSKRKVGNRILTCLIIGLVIYLIAAFFMLDMAGTRDKLQDYQKTSVDDTPVFNLTEPRTQCKYVYNTATKSIVQAKGSEQCELPSFN